MMAVLAIISVLVAAASPSFVRVMRDRRVNNATMKVVDYYRTARMRAIGRGLPMLVTWDASGNLNNSSPGSTGLIQLIEPVIQGTTPPTNCAQTYTSFSYTALTVPPTLQLVDAFDLKNGRYEFTQITFQNDGSPATPQNHAEFCFSPTGRTYYRYGTSGPFSALVGVPSFTVTNTGTGLERTIYVPPNGMARIAL